MVFIGLNGSKMTDYRVTGDCQARFREKGG